MRKIYNFVVMEDVYVAIIQIHTGELFFFGTKEQSKDLQNWKHDKYDVLSEYRIYMESLK